jgi:paraquat-inducible protein A
LYRLVERIGRWSMLDIFVVTMTVALVRFKSLAEITAGPGALAFGSVVILTMLAAMQFDPRLIWDPFDTAAPPPAPAPSREPVPGADSITPSSQDPAHE